MTISAQVIDTIVEWIDDNLHQPLRIDDIARHAGYSKWHLQRLFLQYKGESLGRYIRERKLLLAALIREIHQRVYDICLKYGFDSQQTFTRALTRTFNLPPGATGRTTVAPTEARPSWFSVRAKTSDATPSAAPVLNGAQCWSQTKQHRIKLVEIHHMECLNQLLRQRQAQRRRGQQQTGEQSQEAGSRVFLSYRQTRLGFRTTKDSGYA